MLGQYRLNINAPKETHVMRALPRRTFLARDESILSTFLLFYFQWRSESDGSNKFYGIIKRFK
jgi:hypothetical protein